MQGLSRARIKRVNPKLHRTNATYPIIRTCPAPKCACEPMPQGLNIDHRRQLYGTVPPYHDHVLVHTGVADWPSKIENDGRYPLVQNMKATLKNSFRKAPPPPTLLVSSSSFALSGHDGSEVVSIMKAGLHVVVKPDEMDSFSKTLVDHSELLQQRFPTRPIDEIVALICGHGNRDVRCGIMGPLLENEFKDKLSRSGYTLEHSEPNSARVGLVSHVGGHAFAGNVIIYIPATSQHQDHPLAGRGVWYGRVEPKHVEGIVQHTIAGGVVIEELLRGIN